MTAERKHTQLRLDSMMEALTNTAIGFGVSMSAWVIVSPVTGIYINMRQNLEVTAVFTVISICRQYVLRRIFDGRSPWQAIKSLFEKKPIPKPTCINQYPFRNFVEQAENDCPNCLLRDSCMEHSFVKQPAPKTRIICKADCGQCGGPV